MKGSVCAILLAAGESKRMGQYNKLALPVAGEVPLLRRTAQTLLASKLDEVVVVVGHEQERARELLADLPVNIVVNERYQEGQMTSVYRGMQALQKSCYGVMVCLADQPLLETHDVNLLVDYFLNRPAAILVPTYYGQRGNPIILSAQLRDDILKGERNLGCKRFIEKNPELVTTMEFANDHVVFDLDTAEDYARLQSRLTDEPLEDEDRQAAGGGN